MPRKPPLRDVLSRVDLSRRDKLLAVLRSASGPLPVASIRESAKNAGLRAVAKWNVSSILAHAQGLAARVEEGWVLTADGQRIADLVSAEPIGRTLAAPALELRTLSTQITDRKTRAFVEEAIGCIEQSFLRGACVLSWIGALSVLYDVVVAKHLGPFNAEAIRRNPKWKAATTADDLTRMKEADFLDVLETISVISKSVKTELKGCLDLRNGCGHPNTLRIGRARVAGHIETLINNVFAVF